MKSIALTATQSYCVNFKLAAAHVEVAVPPRLCQFLRPILVDFTGAVRKQNIEDDIVQIPNPSPFKSIYLKFKNAIYLVEVNNWNGRNFQFWKYQIKRVFLAGLVWRFGTPRAMYIIIIAIFWEVVSQRVYELLIIMQ